MFLALCLSVGDSSGSQLLEPHWISIVLPIVTRASSHKNIKCSSHYSPFLLVAAEPYLWSALHFVTLFPTVKRTSCYNIHHTLKCSSHYLPSVSVAAETELALSPSCLWSALTQSPVVRETYIIVTS